MLLLPREWEGKRTIRYLDPADEEKPKLQRATVFLEHRSSCEQPGGQVLVDQLELHGVDLAFCVPGESYLAVLDALHDSPIRLISCRHEAASREHGRGVREAHRPPGDLPRHARPGCDARGDRRPHGASRTRRR